jgi:hypothetical protein
VSECAEQHLGAPHRSLRSVDHAPHAHTQAEQVNTAHAALQVTVMQTHGQEECPNRMVPSSDLPTPDVLAGLNAYIALMQGCWMQAQEQRPTFSQVAMQLESLISGLEPQP